MGGRTTPVTRIIITGPPGSGKSVLIGKLEALGYLCLHEPAREVIREQQAISGSDQLPWQDITGFSDRVFERYRQQLQLPHRGVVFSDRGVPDLIAYLRLAGKEAPERYRCSLPGFRYCPKVFVTPYWPEIFSPDAERHESPEMAESVFRVLVETYVALDFQPVIIPKCTVEERVQFVEDRLKKWDLYL